MFRLFPRLIGVYRVQPMSFPTRGKPPQVLRENPLLRSGAAGVSLARRMAQKSEPVRSPGTAGGFG